MEIEIFILIKRSKNLDFIQIYKDVYVCKKLSGSLNFNLSILYVLQHINIKERCCMAKLFEVEWRIYIFFRDQGEAKIQYKDYANYNLNINK